MRPSKESPIIAIPQGQWGAPHRLNRYRSLECYGIPVGQEHVACLGHRRIPLVILVLVGTFDHRNSSFGSLLGPDPSSAMVAADLLELERLHTLDDVVELRFPILKQGDVKTAVTAVRLVSFDIRSRPGKQ